MTTKRPQNRCLDCGDTWHPRGRNLSHQCPFCRSSNVEIYDPWAPVWKFLGWTTLLTLGFVGLTIVTSPLPDISPNGSYLEDLHR